MPSISQCRACDHPQLSPIISLGETPLANSLLTQAQLAEPEPGYSLDLVFCPNCSLVQITETVPPEVLFSNYFYFSSFSDTMLSSSKALAEKLVAARHLDGNSLVVEIASNDGYLLKNYVDVGVPVLGIEPAQNIAEVAEERGVHTINEFFGKELADTLVKDGHKADIIHANNVMAHVANLNSVVAGIAALLSETGAAVIETPYVKEMIDRREFDTIYHEHLCYYSVTALDKLFRKYGLFVTDIERLPIHGGSLRVYATKADTPSQAVRDILQDERQCGLDHIDYYLAFSREIAQLRQDLKTLLDGLKHEGKTIAAYGASAKGNTLLHYCNIGRETLDFVVDRSTVKQGHFTPGTHLPIHDTLQLIDRMPDYVLMLTWNFAEEILQQQSRYRELGGRFIIPLPEVQIV